MAPTTQTSPLSSTAMVWTSARAPTRLLLTETPLTNSWNSSFTSTWTGTTTVSHIWPPSDMTRTRSFVSRLASLVKTSHGRDLAAKLKSPVYCELLHAGYTLSTLLYPRPTAESMTSDSAHCSARSTKSSTRHSTNCSTQVPLPMREAAFWARAL